MRTALIALLLSSTALAADITLGSGLTVAPGDSIPLPIFLTNPAPPGGVTVALFSSDSTKVSVSANYLYIPGGETAPWVLPRINGIAFGSATVTASAWGLADASQPVRVSARLSGPGTLSIQRGSTQNAIFALNWPTPTAVSLAVRSDNPSVASVPATATIPAGGVSAVIPITGLTLGSSLIHVSALPDIAESTVNATVFTAGSISLPAVTLTLAQSLPFPIALAAPAPSSGVTVTLTSNNPSIVIIAPSTVFIPGGQTRPATQPEIAGENIGAATITASAPGYLTAAREVPVTATITMSPQLLTIPVGGTKILSMILSAAAPSIGTPITPDRAANGFVNGLTVQLTSSDPRVAAVQPTVQFYPDGSSITTVVVVISAIGPGTATIHAGAPPYIPDTTATVVVGASSTLPASIAATGGTGQTAQVNTPFGLPLAATVRDSSGNPVSGATVTFSAPSSGATLTFASANTAVTDSAGVARSQTATANGLPGTYQVLASVGGVATGAAFTLTNVAAASGAISLPVNLTVTLSQSVPCAVALSVPAPAGGVTVALTSSDPAKATVSPATVFIPGGATAPLSQPTVTGINLGSVTIGASASNYASASQLVQIGATLSFSPATLTLSAPGTQSLTLILSAPAPATGLAIILASTNAAAVTVPTSVTLLPNTTTISVPVTAVSAGVATITANAFAPNVPSTSASLTATSSANISMTAGVTVAPAESAPIPLFLTNPARPGGVAIALSSSDPTKATVSPANLYIPEGATAPFGPPQVTGVNFGTASITASAYGLTSATQTVQVVGRLSGPQAQTLQRGATSNLMFALSAPTPSAITLAVTSTNPAVASVPANVTIPANGSIAVVPVTAIAAGASVVRISALPYITESNVSITVQAPGTLTLAAGVSVALGESAALPVTLGAPAPAGGLVVSLASSDPARVAISPNSIFIPAGATVSAAQPVVTGTGIGLATITASAPGYLNATQQVPVTATITVSPTSLVIPAGSTRLLALALSSAAPSSGPITPDRGAGGYVEGLTVQLSSSNPNVASLQPSVQFYPDGSSITTVVVVVSGLNPGTAVIHVSALPFIPDVTANVIVQ